MRDTMIGLVVAWRTDAEAMVDDPDRAAWSSPIAVTDSANTPEDGEIQDLLAAFLASHDSLLDRLYGHISRRIRNDQDGAAEVYQETLLAFAILLYRTPETPTRVIFGIARYKIADYWRKQKRRSVEILIEPAAMFLTVDVLSEASVDPFETITMRIDIEYAYALLDDEHRQVLTLRYIHQLMQEEAAAAMSTSRSNLRRLEATALDKLAKGGTLDQYRRRPPSPEIRRAQA